MDGEEESNNAVEGLTRSVAWRRLIGRRISEELGLTNYETLATEGAPDRKRRFDCGGRRPRPSRTGFS